MTQLPIDQSIPRFTENEERVDIFVNDPLNTGYYETNETVPRQVKTLPSLVDEISESALLRSDVADTASLSKGDALIGVKQPFVGATARTQHSKNQDTITPFDFGAIGNGVTNDTSAFSAMEATIFDIDVDLLGKTFLVDKQFSKNNYFNGFFKLTTDDHTYPANHHSVVFRDRFSDFTLKTEWSDSRYTVDAGLDKAFIILGDSISHGAFCGNSYLNSWVNIFKRMVNNETGGKGYGYTPFLSLGSGATLTKEVHDVAISGAWTYLESSTGGGDILQGICAVNSTPGDYFQFTLPSFQKQIRIWYVEEPGGGSFKWALNGGAETTVSTSGVSTNYAKSFLIDLIDNGKGACQLKITNVSGTIKFTGVGYETTPGTIAGNVVQNFSESGRRLRYATEAMIEKSCMGAVLILALGHNDYADCESTPAYYSEFTQRIDWIIKYCLKYNTTLVVADFCWWVPPTFKARRELKRAAESARGTYVPFPDFLTRDQMLTYEYTNEYYQITTLQKFVDMSHPNEKGHKWIAETMAKCLGLSCTTKQQALAFHDYPFPLQIDSGSIFSNNYPNSGSEYVSNVRRNGNSMIFTLRLKKTAGGTIAPGTYLVNNNFTTANVRQLQFFTNTPVNPAMPMGCNTTGLISNAVTCSLQGGISVESYNAYLGTIDFSFALPLDPTVPAY